MKVGMRSERLRSELADKEAFAELVATDEGLRGLEPAEEIQDFAVLENALVPAGSHRWNRLDGLMVHDAVAVKFIRRTTVEKTQNCAARADDFVQASGDAFHQLAAQVIEDIPSEHGVEFLGRILESILQKVRRHLVWRESYCLFARTSAAQTILFRVCILFPGTQNVLRGKPETAFYEKGQSGLPNRAEVEQAPMLNVSNEPEKILQPIGEPKILCVPIGRHSRHGRIRAPRWNARSDGKSPRLPHPVHVLA